VLYPGLYARVRIPSGEPQSLPAIPEDAVISGQEGHFVYVLTSGNVVQKRTVKVGATVSKAQSESEKASGWKAVVTSAPAPAPENQAPENQAPGNQTPENQAPGGQAPETMQVPSVVSIESGLTVDDLIVFNGLTKARPGIEVVPQTWELKPPAEEPAKKN
jgi:hypothetical protein